MKIQKLLWKDIKFQLQFDDFYYYNKYSMKYNKEKDKFINLHMKIKIVNL